MPWAEGGARAQRAMRDAVNQPARYIQGTGRATTRGASRSRSSESTRVRGEYLRYLGTARKGGSSPGYLLRARAQSPAHSPTVQRRSVTVWHKAPCSSRSTAEGSIFSRVLQVSWPGTCHRGPHDQLLDPLWCPAPSQPHHQAGLRLARVSTFGIPVSMAEVPTTAGKRYLCSPRNRASTSHNLN